MQINFYKNAFKVDEYLSAPSQKSLDEVIALFEITGVNKYFWYTLVNNDEIKIEDWFTLLNDNNIFSLNESKEIENIGEKRFITYWRELEFLEKVSLQLTSEKNQKNLLEIINNLIKEYYKLSEENYILHGHIYWITFKILSNLDSKYIDIYHIDFIEHALKLSDKTLISADLGKIFFGKIFESKNKILIKRFFNLILGFKIEENKLIPLIEDYWLEEFIKEKTSEIPENYKFMILDITLSKIDEILNYDNGAYTTIWFPSIEISSQERFGASSVSKICIDLARDLVESLNPTTIYTKINDLIISKYDILKRLAIHAINCHYEELKDIFWNIKYNPIEENYLNHELHILCQKHVDYFNEEEVTQILRWNEEQDVEYLKEFNGYSEYGQNWVNNDKRKMLYSLKNSKKNPVFMDEFNKYNNLLENEDEHPEFNSYMSESSYSRRKSPYSKEEILTMEIDVLKEKLITFKPSEKSFEDRESISGFGMELESAISENYLKFIDSLNIFLTINQEYQYFIIRALSKNIRSYTNDEFKKSIEYIYSIVERMENNHINSRIMSPISEFIEKISSSEINIEISDEIIEKLIDIFSLLNSKINYYKENDEHQSDILNSNEGQYYSSLIIFSLKIARANKDTLSKNERWNSTLKSIIQNDLENKKSFQLYEIIGRYLANIYYLDEEWIKSKLDNLFIDCNDIYSRSVYVGYFSTPTVYLDIYKDIQEIGVIEKALKYDFDKNKRTNKKIVEFICIAFTSDYEKKLIDNIIEAGTFQQKRELIHFFVNRRGNKKINIEIQLKPLWVNLLSSLNTEEFKPLYNDLIQWINNLESIDSELYKLIKITINKIESFPIHGSIIEKLFKLTDTNTKKISDILILIFQKFNLPYYNNGKLTEAIEIVYKKSLIEEGNRISNLIGQKGDYSLKELFIQYNKL